MGRREELNGPAVRADKIMRVLSRAKHLYGWTTEGICELAMADDLMQMYQRDGDLLDRAHELIFEFCRHTVEGSAWLKEYSANEAGAQRRTTDKEGKSK